MAPHIPGPLYYEQQGKTGLPMVFLHSTPDDNRLWLYPDGAFLELVSHHRRRSRRLWPLAGAAGRRHHGGSGGGGVGSCSTASSDGPVIVQAIPWARKSPSIWPISRPERMPCMILSGCGYLPDIREVFQLKGQRRLSRRRHRAAARRSVRSISTRRCARRSARAVLRRHGLRAQQCRHAESDHRDEPGARRREPRSLSAA